MATSRGMTMRDMKSRSMGKTKKTAPPNTGRRGLERGGRKTASIPGDGEQGEDREELDDMDESMHVAQHDGHFAPTKRLVHDDHEDRDCPDEPPPGWGET